MHSRNSVRYYLIVAAVLIFLFFSNDFGLTDVQKTAIVMAAGIDREGPTFILTAQIAVPQSSDKGEEAQAVQIESRGETVAEAFNQINAKTGWYPKLVFCNLLVLGEDTIKSNVFDALDFFLRDEYMSDNCFVAACEGTAKEILNTQTPIDPMSGVAAQKVLSAHAARVGTVAPMTLREFSIGYFNDNKSGYMPILKPENEQESSDAKGGGGQQQGGSGQEEQTSEEGQNAGAFLPYVPAAAGSSTQSAGGQKSQGEEEKKVFSAAETALFYDGIYADKLDADETFAFSMVMDKLRLASYTPVSDGVPYTLIVKHNQPSFKFSGDKNATAKLNIKLKVTAGLQGTAFSQSVHEMANSGNVPEKVFEDASKDLTEKITRVFEKSRKTKCDIFNAVGRLKKFEHKYFSAFHENLLDRLVFSVDVRFDSLR